MQQDWARRQDSLEFDSSYAQLVSAKFPVTHGGSAPWNVQPSRWHGRELAKG